MRKAEQFGAGEGIDRDTTVFQENAILPPNEEGVLFTIGLDIPNIGKRLIVARAPKTQHSPRMTHHGAGSEPSIYTQAEIVDAFLKNGNSANEAAGKWSEWAEGNFKEMVDKYSDLFARKVKAFVDDHVRQSRREWLHAIRSKRGQARIRPLRDKIAKTYEEQREHARLAKRRMPDFESIYASGSVAVIEAAKADRVKFLKERRSHKDIARDLFYKHRGLVAELRELKREIVEKARSRDLADEIVSIETMLRSAEDMGDRTAMKDYQDRLFALTNPFQIGANISAILKSAAQTLQYDLRALMLGMKAPPLSDQTVHNRKWRGYEGGTPLVESGEFAESLYAEVI